MSIFLALLLAGIMLGIIYGVVAVGFVMVYKATGIFNIAQGEMVAFGAFISYQFLNVLNLNPALAILLALVAGFAMGIVLSYFPFRPILGQSMFSLFVMALGLMIFLRGTLLAVWGSDEVRYFRPFIPTSPIRLGELGIYWQDVLGFGLASAMLLGFWWFFKYSRLGLSFRAVSENSSVAQSMGISLGRVTALALGIGGMVAALGGVILGLKFGINVYVADLGLGALAAVLIGGMESITGAVLGGLLIGVVYALATFYAPGSLGDIAAYLMMLAVLFVRPQGLLGQKRIERV